jgi:hypothetical protein
VKGMRVIVYDECDNQCRKIEIWNEKPYGISKYQDLIQFGTYELTAN